jgi:type II secretory pathway pseudopilin PulG
MIERTGQRRHGLSLLETLLAATILATVAAAAALPFSAGLQQVQQAARLEQAAWLGAALMDEILAHPFDDPDQPGSYTLGPDTGEIGRASFDNIDDYHGYSEALTGARTSTGSPLSVTDAAGLYRTVTIQYRDLPGQAITPTKLFVEVVINVWDGTANVVSLRRYVTRAY